MQQEIAAIEGASRAMQRINIHGRKADFRLENGIVLEIKTVPPLLLNAVAAEFPDPEPPTIFIEELGRNEPNPNHPDYEKALAANAEARDLAVNNVVLAAGTKVKEIPEGMYGPEDEGWVEGVNFANKMSGIDVKVEPLDGDKSIRYLQWLRFYAMETSMDIALAQSLSFQLAGIREGEIDEVFESFRNSTQRGTDIPSETPPGDSNGDTDNRAARRSRSRARRT